MNPMTRLRTVDLPAPDAPTRAMVSPGVTEKVKSRTAGRPPSSYTCSTFWKVTAPRTEVTSDLPWLSSSSGAWSTSPTERTDSRPLVMTGARPANVVVELVRVVRKALSMTTSPGVTPQTP
jgi:hypothetical protein